MMQKGYDAIISQPAILSSPIFVTGLRQGFPASRGIFSLYSPCGEYMEKRPPLAGKDRV